MSDETPSVVSRQLHAAAADGRAPSEQMIHSVIREADRQISRRRMLMMSLPAAAAVVGVATVPSLLAGKAVTASAPGGTTASDSPATSSAPATTTASAGSPKSGPPEVPYISAERKLMVNGRAIQRPAEWSIENFFYAAGIGVFDITPENDKRSTAIESGGTLQEIQEIIGPVDISRDGTLVLAVSRTSSEVVVYDVRARKVIASLPGGYQPEGFIGDQRPVAWVRTFPGLDESLLWDFRSGKLSSTPVPKGFYADAASATGDAWVGHKDGDFGNVSLFGVGKASAVWTARVDEFRSIELSPDGASVVIGASGMPNGDLVVLDARSGQRKGTLAGLSAGAWSVKTWEPSGTFLIADEIHEVPLQRCDLSVLQCVALDGGARSVAHSRD
jgi:WD40 repeat protein